MILHNSFLTNDTISVKSESFILAIIITVLFSKPLIINKLFKVEGIFKFKAVSTSVKKSSKQVDCCEFLGFFQNLRRYHL
jgi:hypothetical protein